MLTRASYTVDETYIKVGKSCKYFYRAVDSMGHTIEFMLSANRNVLAAKRFFKKMMRADHRRLPFTILGYRSFDTVERTIQGVEFVNMIRKGQVKRLDRSDAMGAGEVYRDPVRNSCVGLV